MLYTFLEVHVITPDSRCEVKPESCAQDAICSMSAAGNIMSCLMSLSFVSYCIMMSLLPVFELFKCICIMMSLLPVFEHCNVHTDTLCNLVMVSKIELSYYICQVNLLINSRLRLLGQLCNAASANLQRNISLACQLLIIQYPHGPLQTASTV